MTRTLTISDTGLRLIKAFEGFRPDDVTLVTGVRVVGYGHRLEDDEDGMHVSRVEAEEILLEDLEPVEVLINDEVHAPLTQGQYDALCSLGFNIGLDALRHSDIVRALNNGRILDAANGFDVWRKATVNGQTYVVDALMRRRTAEKSLFLRNDPAVPAPTAMLKPQMDPSAPWGPTDDGLPRVSDDPDAGIIEAANLMAQDVVDGYESADADIEIDDETEDYALEDALIADLEEFETAFEPDAVNLTVDEDEDDADVSSDDLDDDVVTLSADDIVEEDLDMVPDFDPDMVLNAADLDDNEIEVVLPSQTETEEEKSETSSIAEAANSLGDRLSALLDTDDVEDAEVLAESIPESLVGPNDETPRSNLVSFPKRELVLTDEIDEETTLSLDPQPDETVAPEATKKDILMIDNLAEDDVIRASRDPEQNIFDPEGDPVENATLYLERRKAEKERQKRAGGGFWIPLVIGSTLLGASAVLMGRGATELLSNWGPSAVIAAAITGGLMMLFALYAFVRGRFA